MDYNSILNISLLCISWARIKYSDIDTLDKAIDKLLEIKENLNEENIDEVCKIIWTYYILNHPNEKINDFLAFFLEKELEKLNVNNVVDLFISFSSLFPQNIEILDLLIDSIIDQKNDPNLILDINTYINIWLGLSKYYIKGKNDSIEGISNMIKFLLSSYDKRKYLYTDNMTLDEICSLLVSFSVLDLEPNKIFKDLGISIKHNMNRFDNIQLIQLISCGKYLFNSQTHSDIYNLIHDACVKSNNMFDNNQIKNIKRILTRDAIITESLFLK